jgi:hypothetical protein
VLKLLGAEFYHQGAKDGKIVLVLVVVLVLELML